MNAWTYVGCIVLASCLTSSCEKRGTEPTGEPFYFNSFESTQDTTGWHGVAAAMFVSDPAPAGGKQSLHIGGGCIQPAAYIDLPQQTRGGYYRLRCWGKLVDISQRGSIGLVVNAETEQRREIHLVISDTAWTSYESEEPFRCPADHHMRMEILIGGFVPASMFVDCIAVERIW
jgi:hypothetical protein